ncbi:MAG: RNA methyltransferase [Anaerolineae bacterium]|nr:RNA methyltransferase [Phycisphaerae bacterium]
MKRGIAISSIDDPRIANYRDVKDRELAVMSNDLFMVESEQLVRRLLASSFEVESVLVTEKRAAEIAALVPANVPVFIAAAEVVNQIIGFKFHSGMMAIARRGTSPTLEEVIADKQRALIVVCPEIANTENLGSMIRIAAAFGADAMLIGERSCDPFFRQSVRVSMGAVFKLPIVRSTNIIADLRSLHERGVELVATVLDESAEALGDVKPPPRVAVLFGNEAQGLSPDHIALCGRRVTIPMKLGTDSLNVAVAAGVFLYHFSR